jgi:3'-5' exoribonuclease 1
MLYVVVDLEATCWDDGGDRNRMEIIEIGAVRLDNRYRPVDEFSEFVRPTAYLTLSAFCRELTTITQEQVDGAETFPAVFNRFIDWIGPRPARLCSWGNYDLRQFESDCRRHGIAMPAALASDHINLKMEFARWQGVRPCGMARALDQLGLDLAGTHHRGIDDARNIARIAQQVLATLP